MTRKRDVSRPSSSDSERLSKDGGSKLGGVRWTPCPSFDSILEPFRTPVVLFEHRSGKVLDVSRSFLAFLDGRDVPQTLSGLNRLFASVMPRRWSDPDITASTDDAIEPDGHDLRWCCGHGGEFYLAFQLNVPGLAEEGWGTTIFRSPPDPLAALLNEFGSGRERWGPGQDLERLLSRRERQVLNLVRLRYSAKTIAGLLGISANTVAVHRAHIRHKLGIQSQW